MGNPELLISHDHRVAQDAGQFYLICTEDGFDQMMSVMDEAIMAGIAQQGGFAMVMSPVQNNFDMALTVEVWSSAPPEDLDLWQEAFELHLDVSKHGLLYSWTNGDVTDLGVPPGSYRALITAKGFLVGGWPGSTTPGDVWRIRLHLDDAPVTPRRIREFVQAVPERPEPQFEEAGREAVRRLYQMLNDRGPLTGNRGAVHVERLMPGSRRKLYKYFETPYGWLTQSGGGADGKYTISGSLYDDDNPFNDSNRIVPQDGTVECEIVDAKSPQYVEATWSWQVVTSWKRDTWGMDIADTREPVIPPTPPMTLRFELFNGPATEDWPTTLVKVIHDQVPEEFVDDLTAYWLWKLEDADYGFDLSDERQKVARAAQTSSTRVPDGV